MPDKIKLLRYDPDKAFSSIGFYALNDGKSGSCGIKSAKIGPSVYSIKPDFNKAGCYFFPYGLHSNPGKVTVPLGQPDGTVVFTSGMNGCSLQVNRIKNGFVFYHDGNSNSLSGNEPGDIVCRVGPKDYDRFNRGDSLADNYRDKNHVGRWAVAVVTIHHGGKWKVYISNVLTRSHMYKGTITTASTYMGSITPLMTSFKDL